MQYTIGWLISLRDPKARIQSGEVEASIYDIASTMLALMGLREKTGE